jgi:hypothetical protein
MGAPKERWFVIPVEKDGVGVDDIWVHARSEVDAAFLARKEVHQKGYDKPEFHVRAPEPQPPGI